MKDVAAVELAKKPAQNTDNAAGLAEEAIGLHRHYGQIGISAVAAAARYQGAAKNPAYAPVAINWDGHSGETT